MFADDFGKNRRKGVPNFTVFEISKLLELIEIYTPISSEDWEDIAKHFNKSFRDDVKDFHPRDVSSLKTKFKVLKKRPYSETEETEISEEVKRARLAQEAIQQKKMKTYKYSDSDKLSVSEDDHGEEKSLTTNESFFHSSKSTIEEATSNSSDLTLDLVAVEECGKEYDESPTAQALRVGNRKKGIPNYSSIDIVELLGIIEKILPVTKEEWNRVAFEFNAVLQSITYGQGNHCPRDVTSLRSKFKALKKRPQSEAENARLSSDVLRARSINAKIEKKILQQNIAKSFETQENELFPVQTPIEPDFAVVNGDCFSSEIDSSLQQEPPSHIAIAMTLCTLRTCNTEATNMTPPSILDRCSPVVLDDESIDTTNDTSPVVSSPSTVSTPQQVQNVTRIFGTHSTVNHTRTGIPNYSAAEVSLLLHCIEKKLPTTSEEWDELTGEFNKEMTGKYRDTQSLRWKFKMLKQKSSTEIDSSQVSEETKKARELNSLIDRNRALRLLAAKKASFSSSSMTSSADSIPHHSSSNSMISRGNTSPVSSRSTTPLMQVIISPATTPSVTAISSLSPTSAMFDCLSLKNFHEQQAESNIASTTVRK